jgi:uncharacterized protein YbjQ (UPF0145 family)
MSQPMKLLVVAHASIDSEDVCDAIVERAGAGSVHVTLISSTSVGAGPLCAPRTAYGEGLVRAYRREMAERMERAMQRLRDAGVAVEGVLGAGSDAADDVEDVWEPSGFDEVVVSCRPWLSWRRAVAESGPDGP